MALNNLIKELQNSDLYAECGCGEEFKLADSLLFDGFGKFPVDALEKQKELEQALKDLADRLKTKKKRATVGSAKTAKAVGIGKNIEKILPTLKDFNYEIPDCRFLGDPLDLLIFKGLTKNKIDTITFMEVKTGGARLNKNQKMVKDAIEDERVRWRTMK
jgi:predicted Holliday junction resolvase-like endonuclease